MGVASCGISTEDAHHGFIIIIGDAEELQYCGACGFNAFQGHDVRVITEDGMPDDASLSIVRSIAFHGDGAIIVDGKSGKILASGWFVTDIREGGSSGGARSRSAKAIARQANGCYVIKCSEDSM